MMVLEKREKVVAISSTSLLGFTIATIHKKAATAEIGRNPTRFSLSMENEHATAGRDCRTRLARPNCQARRGTGKYLFFPIQLTTSRIGNLTRLILTLGICDDHTYIWSECMPTLYQ